jgi:hypothetical protein
MFTAVEGEAQGHPDERPVERFLDGHGVRTLLAQDDEIDEQGHQHRGDENAPQPGRRDGSHGQQPSATTAFERKTANAPRTHCLPATVQHG